MTPLFSVLDPSRTDASHVWTLQLLRYRFLHIRWIFMIPAKRLCIICAVADEVRRGKNPTPRSALSHCGSYGPADSSEWKVAGLFTASGLYAENIFGCSLSKGTWLHHVLLINACVQPASPPRAPTALQQTNETWKMSIRTNVTVAYFKSKLLADSLIHRGTDELHLLASFILSVEGKRSWVGATLFDIDTAAKQGQDVWQQIMWKAPLWISLTDFFKTNDSILLVSSNLTKCESNMYGESR